MPKVYSIYAEACQGIDVFYELVIPKVEESTSRGSLRAKPVMIISGWYLVMSPQPDSDVTR